MKPLAHISSPHNHVIFIINKYLISLINPDWKNALIRVDQRSKP
jgi:hypothetical protein